MEKKPEYSLFIGRWQPLHEGHKKLIQKVLDEGKNVCIVMRDTGVNEKNPHTLQERSKMFFEAWPEETRSGRMMIFGMPDIVEVCHGRDVGWKVREIKLDEQTEKISATKIREKKYGHVKPKEVSK